MAAHMISSALTKTKMLNERFAHDLLRHNIQRDIQQRRKTRDIFYRGFKVYLTPRQNRTGTCITFLTLDCCWTPTNCGHVGRAGKCVRTVHLDSGHRGKLEWQQRVCVSSHGSGNLKITRDVLTSGVRHKSVDTPEQSRTVASWEMVKKKERQIREAGQDLLEDFKERKAKVREKVDEIIERENIWTVPNFLCVSRIAISPVLFHLVLSANYNLALGFFMFAGFTDLIDGWIARTFPGQASNLGSFLDPLADKVLVASLFLSLTYIGLIPLPLTGLIIYRDVLIIGGASYVRYKSLPPPRTIFRYFDATHATAKLAPTALSKVNTAIQLGLITASLAAPVFSFTDHYLLKAFWWLAAATTLSSGISYIFSRDTYKFLNNMNKPPEK
ncbi:cardiolipin synthase (CMP-forming)-like [Panulirus ornatus]|uniref:cardiolipin synthase (CMP-forming)-like n=1 Tax=Panulirus ornatus TaxID=150431 RepID=UPI003A861EF3